MIWDTLTMKYWQLCLEHMVFALGKNCTYLTSQEATLYKYLYTFMYTTISRCVELYVYKTSRKKNYFMSLLVGSKPQSYFTIVNVQL